MTEAVLTATPGRKSAADSALSAAAGLWFFAAVIGQWVFLYYIVAVYGTSTLSGDFEAWNADTFLRKGFVAGDTMPRL